MRFVRTNPIQLVVIQKIAATRIMTCRSSSLALALSNAEVIRIANLNWCRIAIALVEAGTAGLLRLSYIQDKALEQLQRSLSWALRLHAGKPLQWRWYRGSYDTRYVPNESNDIPHSRHLPEQFGQWIGLAFTAVCLAAAVQLRRHRDPI